MMVAAATGSVGDRMAPNTNAACHDIPGIIACAAAATPAIVTTTRTTVLNVKPRKLVRKSSKLA
jgi:hypothetical protein